MAKYKTVVVGAGSISNAWFPKLIEEKVDIVGVVDLNLENAKKSIKEFGLTCSASSDLAGTLKNARHYPRALFMSFSAKCAGHSPLASCSSRCSSSSMMSRATGAAAREPLPPCSTSTETA